MDVSGDYSIDFSLPGPSDFCLFPFFSLARSLTYGFPSARGRAQIRTAGDTWSCSDRVCSADVPGSHYAVFSSGGGSVILQGKEAKVSQKNCRSNWFSYVDLSRNDQPSLPDAQMSLNCPGRASTPTRKANAPRESHESQAAQALQPADSHWDEIAVVVIVVVAIVAILVIAGACHRGYVPRMYRPAPVYGPTVYGPTVYGPTVYGPTVVEPPVYIGGFPERRFYDDDGRRRDRGFREVVHRREEEQHDQQGQRWESGGPVYRNLPPEPHLEGRREEQPRSRSSDEPRVRHDSPPASSDHKLRNVPPPPPPGLSRAPPLTEADPPARRNVPPPPPPGMRKAAPLRED
jgi:hypothetical protein